MRYHYYTCDVFTDTLFGGNPLAVIPQAGGMSPSQMQRIAREFNYSETAFVLPAEQDNTNRVRIFSPTRELPFAGHPNIGTAFTLAQTGAFGQIGETHQICFEEEAGLVAIAIKNRPGGALWCELKAPEQLFVGQTPDVTLVANALTLSVDDIDTTVHPPQQASVGLSFVITRLKSKAALQKATINISALREIERPGIRPSLYVYTPGDEGFDIRCRMFAPLGGTPEDPATGSANCALAGLLAHCDARADAQYQWHITQGVEMGRPSVLDARAEKSAGQVSGVWIGGGAVMVSEGDIEAGEPN